MNHQEFNINGGVFNGPVTGINHGDVKQDLKILENPESNLIYLLNQLKQNQLSCHHAENILKDLATLKSAEKKERKVLIDRIVDTSKKLLELTQASTKLYPIALKVFEFIKNLEF